MILVLGTALCFFSPITFRLLAEGHGKAEEKMQAGHQLGVAVNLEGQIYTCRHCETHLAIGEDILSKSFHCKHGRAYLFSTVANVSTGEREERMMMTGMHTVADISCVGCGEIVGWKYETAHENSQKFKEGKFLLERYKLVGPDGSTYCASQDADIIGGSDADDV